MKAASLIVRAMFCIAIMGCENGDDDRSCGAGGPWIIVSNESSVTVSLLIDGNRRGAAPADRPGRKAVAAVPVNRQVVVSVIDDAGNVLIEQRIVALECGDVVNYVVVEEDDGDVVAINLDAEATVAQAVRDR